MAGLGQSIFEKALFLMPKDLDELDHSTEILFLCMERERANNWKAGSCNGLNGERIGISILGMVGGLAMVG